MRPATYEFEVIVFILMAFFTSIVYLIGGIIVIFMFKDKKIRNMVLWDIFQLYLANVIVLVIVIFLL